MIREYEINGEIYIEIEVSEGNFVSMSKSVYDELQAKQNEGIK